MWEENGKLMVVYDADAGYTSYLSFGKCVSVRKAVALAENT